MCGQNYARARLTSRNNAQYQAECGRLPPNTALCRCRFAYVRIDGLGNRMQESLPGKPPSATPPGDRLDSWKEIAAYLNRDVTTAQRWEKREGMPVHRHLHARAGSVYAFREELAEWARTRSLSNTQNNGSNEVGLNVPHTASGGSQALPVKGAKQNKRTFLLAAAVSAALATGASLWFERSEFFWRSPLAGARFEVITELGGVAQAAAISRDGHLIAFLSDRDGPIDVWLTQAGSGEFHNLTRGSVRELVNPSVRTLGFSPDGSLVMFWVREKDPSGTDKIGIWVVPTLGGQARPYMEGVAELDWSHDGSRLAYHTPGPGDPLFVSRPGEQRGSRPIFEAPAGQHAHFPLWAPDDAFIYFAQGSLPDKLDIWRIAPQGGTAERITSQVAVVTHPVLLNKRMLLYLASGSDNSGPWLYSMDLDHRIPHRLTSALDRYTSLAASADGRRLVITRTIPKATLWRLRAGDTTGKLSRPDRISLTTSTGFSPRYGPGYLLYVSASGASESVWKLRKGAAVQLWSGEKARIIGAPVIAPDAHSIAFSVRQGGRTPLYVMRSDGTDARIVSDSLALEGSVAWSPDGQSITSALEVNGVPQLFRVAVNGGSSAHLVNAYSVDPSWAPDGQLVVYSGPDIGTTFAVKAARADGAPYSRLDMTLTRGARRLKFLPGSRRLVFLRGDIQHRDLWSLDLDTGIEQQLSNLAPDFDVRDFDISADGREIVLQRSEEHSDVVLVDLAR